MYWNKKNDKRVEAKVKSEEICFILLCNGWDRQFTKKLSHQSNCHYECHKYFEMLPFCKAWHFNMILLMVTNCDCFIGYFIWFFSFAVFLQRLRKLKREDEISVDALIAFEKNIFQSFQKVKWPVAQHLNLVVILGEKNHSLVLTKLKFSLTQMESLKWFQVFKCVDRDHSDLVVCEGKNFQLFQLPEVFLWYRLNWWRTRINMNQMWVSFVDVLRQVLNIFVVIAREHFNVIIESIAMLVSQDKFGRINPITLVNSAHQHSPAVQIRIVRFAVNKLRLWALNIGAEMKETQSDSNSNFEHFFQLRSIKTFPRSRVTELPQTTESLYLISNTEQRFMLPMN